MSSSSPDTSALVCVPGAIPANERSKHFTLAQQLFHQTATEKRALKNGYELRLPVAALPDVGRFILNERLCCPFVRFEITLDPEAEILRFSMTGPEGTREVLEAELSLRAKSCACAAC